jgi:hypothetical protein
MCESTLGPASVPLQASRRVAASVALGSARSSSSVFHARHSEHCPFHFGCYARIRCSGRRSSPWPAPPVATPRPRRAIRAPTPSADPRSRDSPPGRRPVPSHSAHSDAQRSMSPTSTGITVVRRVSRAFSRLNRSSSSAVSGNQRARLLSWCQSAGRVETYCSTV